MINKDAKLHTNVLILDKLESAATRDGFGHGLVEAGEADEQVVALCADLAESTRSHWFQEKFPDRYIEIGVAEQNLATVAAGMAVYGKIPFIMSYAAFSPGRNNEQIRTTISLNEVPVIVVGCHAGVSVGPDGATHQQLEDIALMRVQPNMTVVVPCDSIQAHKATVALAQSDRPGYIRLGRSGSPVFTTADTPFEIGKSYVYYDTPEPDVVLLATGSLVHTALLAAQELETEGVHASVVNVATIKPLDTETIFDIVERAGAVVTIEEHQTAGGMGSAVAEALAQSVPVPMEFIGVHDQFGQSGEPEELIKHYGMDVPSIIDAAKKVIKRK
jgi:transketolase